MSDLKAYLDSRRRKLTEALAPLMDQRAQIDMQIQRLRRELGEIDQAAKAVGLESSATELQLIAEHRSKPTKTIKEAVVDILQDHPNGLTALDILARINLRFQLGIVRTSLSPQLSRLKQDGTIINAGTIWRLVEHKKEGPTL